MATLTSSLNAERELALFEFTQGIDLDAPMAAEEVAVQKAWVRALVSAGRLTVKERDQLLATYDRALQLMQKGEFDWQVADEDIHMNLERFVTETLGELGQRIHLGRSRNDLIATTLRLFVARNIDQFQALVDALVQALVRRAREDLDVIVPGLTHLQFGQPLRLAQIYLAHAWSLRRDLKRLQNAQEEALQALPLGAAALSGTTLEVDLEALAQDLGFAGPLKNSYDAVGDRDFILQALDSYAQLAGHLSRLSADVIQWSATSCGWVALPPQWSTGSSIMPNKRNPDVAELVRGKSAQVMAGAQGASVLLKGLVSSYSSDLHELKRLYQSVLSPLQHSLQVLAPFVAALQPRREKIQEDLQKGHLLATEIANALVENGLSFRQAYQLVADLVSQAEDEGVMVHQLSLEAVQALAPQTESPVDWSFWSDLRVEAAVEARGNLGGTSRTEVERQLAEF